jgi:hypothetical protein
VTGQWSGGAANRYWQRPGSRLRDVEGDAERGRRLYELLKDERFWCDNCGGMHPLREHRDCREQNPFRSAYRGAT